MNFPPMIPSGIESSKKMPPDSMMKGASFGYTKCTSMGTKNTGDVSGKLPDFTPGMSTDGTMTTESGSNFSERNGVAKAL